MTPAQHQAMIDGSYAGPTVTLTVDGSVHYTAPLAVGRYTMLCPDTPMYVRQGGAGISVSSSDHELDVGERFDFNVDDTNSNRIAVTTASGLGGTCYITRTDYSFGGSTPNVALHASQALATFIGPAQQLDLSDGAAHVIAAPLTAPARYRVVCFEADIHLAQGGSSVIAGTGDGLVLAGEARYLNVDDTLTNTLSALATAAVAGATLRITRVDSV